MNSDTKPLVRAACYCRISSDPDDKREGTARQREDTAALCEVKGWQIVDYYVDDNRSASNGKRREQWERLLADVEAGKIDAVAAWDQDRVNRTLDDLISYKKLFVARGILLATSNNGDIDLSTPAGELMATIKTAVSTHEIAMMRVRQLRAARQRAESGRPKWRRAFGYLPDTRDKKDDDGTRQIDDEPRYKYTCVVGDDGAAQRLKSAHDLVQDAYAGLLAKVSLGDLAKRFNEAGAFGLNGRPWAASTMSLFLRSARNAGLRSHNGKVVGTGTWPPLVDKATWDEAQRFLTCGMAAGDHRASRKPGKKSTTRHLLTGVMRCGKCATGTLSGYQTTAGVQAYTCRRCHGLSIRTEHVVPWLYDVVAERLSRPDARDLLKGEVDEAEAAAISRELGVAYARLEGIGVDYAEGLLTGQQAKIATETVDAKIAALESRQQDSEKLRVFAGLPLGEPQVSDAVRALPHGRFRAILNLLMTVTIAPVGKGSHVFDPDRVGVEWH